MNTTQQESNNFQPSFVNLQNLYLDRSQNWHEKSISDFADLFILCIYYLLAKFFNLKIKGSDQPSTFEPLSQSSNL